MDLITLKKKFKQHNNFLKIFNHNKKAKQEFQRLEFLRITLNPSSGLKMPPISLS